MNQAAHTKEQMGAGLWIVFSSVLPRMLPASDTAPYEVAFVHARAQLNVTRARCRNIYFRQATDSLLHYYVRIRSAE